VTGEMRDGEFALEQVSIRQSLPFADEVEYWSIQGYALADPNAVQLRFSGYHGALRGGSDVALDTSAEQRVIVGIRAASSSTPTIHRVRMSPLRHPDASMRIPGYSPTQVRPAVVIAPNLQTGERAQGSEISISRPRHATPLIIHRHGYQEFLVTRRRGRSAQDHYHPGSTSCRSSQDHYPLE
jgi:hypothetical protein